MNNATVLDMVELCVTGDKTWHLMVVVLSIGTLTTDLEGGNPRERPGRLGVPPPGKKAHKRMTHFSINTLALIRRIFGPIRGEYFLYG